MAQPLRVRMASEHAHLQRALSNLYAEWWSEWCCIPPTGKDDQGVAVRDDTTSASSKLDTAPDLPHALLRPLVLGESPTAVDMGGVRPGSRHSIANGLVEQAWAAWIERLCHATGHAGAGNAVAGVQTPSAPMPWSGAVEIVFSMGESDWTLQLNAHEVDYLLAQTGYGASPASAGALRPGGLLVSLPQALQNRTVRVTAELAPVTLSLGQLQSLSVGDVVSLSHSLDAPAQLYLTPSDAVGPEPVASTLLCNAWLGQVNGNMAVELHPLP